MRCACCGMLRDLERSTMQRMRNLLVTATHKDARVTAFLTTWAYEKFWIADALDAVLEAGDNEHAADAPTGRRRRTLAERAERRGPIRRAVAANFAGPQIVAAHVTTGLVDEWITQAAYRRLGELAGGLHAVVDRIVTIKDRHIRFLAEEAQRRLAASPRASKLTRTEIKRSAWPIGAVDRAADDRTFFETIVFGTPAGAAEAGRIRDLVGSAPRSRVGGSDRFCETCAVTPKRASTDLGRSHVFLTGATGFVGQAVLERLLSDHPETTISILVRAKAGADTAGRVQRPAQEAGRSTPGASGSATPPSRRPRRSASASSRARWARSRSSPRISTSSSTAPRSSRSTRRSTRPSTPTSTARCSCTRTCSPRRATRASCTSPPATSAGCARASRRRRS